MGAAVSQKNFFRKDTPLYLTILLTLISGAVVYSFFPHPSEGKKVTIVSQTAVECAPEMEIVRSKDYKLAHRVLLSNTVNENPRLSSIKGKVSQYISQNKDVNGVSDISIYYRNLTDGAWFQLNGGDVYNPASLMKVTFLMAVLKEAESNPRLLDKQIFFTKHFEQSSSQNIKDFRLPENRSYTMRELLQFMIIHSDNDAATLVSQNTNMLVYRKLFSDLNIPQPPNGNSEYFISVIDYCKFFRVLYNSSYLRDEYSEFALDVLSKSTYKGGLLKNLATGFPVSHKFGERIMGKVQQLHDVGIFYVDHQPYILGVMSSGQSLDQLSSVVSHVSEIIYEESIRLN